MRCIYGQKKKGERALYARFTSFAQSNTDTGHTLDNEEEGEKTKQKKQSKLNRNGDIRTNAGQTQCQ